MPRTSSPRIASKAASTPRSRSPVSTPLAVAVGLTSTMRRPRSQGNSTSSPAHLSMRPGGAESVETSSVQSCGTSPSESPSARALSSQHSTPPVAKLSPISPQRTSRPLKNEAGRYSATAGAPARAPVSLTSSVARRGMRHGRGRSPTLGITDADAVRAAREFSMEAYRSIHQRKFMSANEELDFLRKDFVSSRKTLALLHEENYRLDRELLTRATEVQDLQRKLEDVQREDKPRVLGNSRQTTTTSNSYQRENYASGEQCDALTAPHTGVGMGSQKNVHLGPTSEEEKCDLCWPLRDVDKKDTSPTTMTPTRISAPGTSLSLYAVSGKWKRGAASGKGGSFGDPNGADVQQLVRELRANLARRDTSLNELQMQLGAQQNIRRTLEADLHRLQGDLSEVKKQRDALQAQLTAQEELRAATATQVGGLEMQLQQLKNEKEDVQRRLTTAELLYEHTSSRGSTESPSSAVGADGKRAQTQEEGLRDQLQLYRSKWQAAENQMEHLHERISQLQRQLVAGKSGEAVTFESQKTVACDASSDVRAIIMDAKNTADVAALRRQHQEQLQLHIEEVQRLQRRLERARENATFHEDQLRQQRQDDARQHHSEVQMLQTQLRTAQGELVQAQQDREHLARQLRRSTEQETTVEVLRGQVDQLKQRLGEVGTELAQIRGREKEMSLQVQRERLERAKVEHDFEATQEMLKREKTEAQFLREELKLSREQLGMHEATEASMPIAGQDRPSLSSKVAPGTTDLRENKYQRSARITGCTCNAEGDAETLSSELKGYVSLMRVNTALQRRIGELERDVSILQCSGSSKPRSSHTTNDEGLKLVQPTTPEGMHSAAATTPSQPELERVAHLQEELSRTLQAHHSLEASLEEVMNERRQLIDDNRVLASGIELLEKRIRKSRAKRVQQKNAGDTHSPQREVRPPCAGATGVQPRGHLDVVERPPQENAHRSSDMSIRDSRLRSRLQTARTQDQDVVLRCSDGGNLLQAQPKQVDDSEAVKQNAGPVCHGRRGHCDSTAVTRCDERLASTAPSAVAQGVSVAEVADRTDAECRCSRLLRVEVAAKIVPRCETQAESKDIPTALNPSCSSPTPLPSPSRELNANRTAPRAEKHSTPENVKQLPKRISPPQLRSSWSGGVYGSILPPVFYPPLVAHSWETLALETPHQHHYSS